jgi:hypothetical protein
MAPSPSRGRLNEVELDKQPNTFAGVSEIPKQNDVEPIGNCIARNALSGGNPLKTVRMEISLLNTTTTFESKERTFTIIFDGPSKLLSQKSESEWEYLQFEVHLSAHAGEINYSVSTRTSRIYDGVRVAYDRLQEMTDKHETKLANFQGLLALNIGNCIPPHFRSRR